MSECLCMWLCLLKQRLKTDVRISFLVTFLFFLWESLTLWLSWDYLYRPTRSTCLCLPCAGVMCAPLCPASTLVFERESLTNPGAHHFSEAVSQRACLHQPAPGLQACGSTLSFLCTCWGSSFRSLFLSTKYFTH